MHLTAGFVLPLLYAASTVLGQVDADLANYTAAYLTNRNVNLTQPAYGYISMLGKLQVLLNGTVTTVKDTRMHKFRILDILFMWYITRQPDDSYTLASVQNGRLQNLVVDSSDGHPIAGSAVYTVNASEVGRFDRFNLTGVDIQEVGPVGDIDYYLKICLATIPILCLTNAVEGVTMMPIATSKTGIARNQQWALQPVSIPDGKDISQTAATLLNEVNADTAKLENEALAEGGETNTTMHDLNSTSTKV